jgi:hypothetical protein
MVKRARAESRFAVATAAAVLATISIGCNHRSPLRDAGGSIAPSPPAPAPIALFGISLNPPGLFGSAPGSGTAILTRQAQDSNIVVTLSSADPAIAAVPATVTIPEGTDRAIFPITTQTVSADRQVPISASAMGTAASATLQVWAVLPSFFSWFSDPGDAVGRGGFGRLTPTTATFTASGGDGGVTVLVSGQGNDFWRLEFAPPRNTRLQIGRYEDAMRSTFRDAIHPGLDIGGRGIGCNTVAGRFEVREFIVTVTQTGSFTTTTLSRFDATFEQHCSGADPALRGEVRYSAGAR